MYAGSPAMVFEKNHMRESLPVRKVKTSKYKVQTRKGRVNGNTKLWEKEKEGEILVSTLA